MNVESLTFETTLNRAGVRWVPRSLVLHSSSGAMPPVARGLRRSQSGRNFNGGGDAPNAEQLSLGGPATRRCVDHCISQSFGSSFAPLLLGWGRQSALRTCGVCARACVGGRVGRPLLVPLPNIPPLIRHAGPRFLRNPCVVARSGTCIKLTLFSLPCGYMKFLPHG